MIIATRGGGSYPLEQRDANLAMMLRAIGVDPRSMATPVSQTSVSGLPAAMRAVRIASEAVMIRPLRVWRGEGSERRLVTNTWQSRFFSGPVANDRNEPWSLVLEQLEASLTSRNNGYWLKLKDEKLQVTSVYTLHPDNVAVRWSEANNQPEYQVTLPTGRTSDWLGPDRVLHFRVGSPDPGSLTARTPVQIHRDALGAAVAKTKYESRYYADGIMQSVAVTFPREVKPDEADRYRQVFQKTHGGMDGAFNVRVFGGGAQVEKIGLTLEDSQYIESMHFSVEEIARIYGVLASLLGAGTKYDRPITPEHEAQRWVRFGLDPRLIRIEDTICADPDFFGAGARTYPGFDRTGLIHGDVATESSRVVALKQAGLITANEGRGILGIAPKAQPGADDLLETPVGGAPNATPSQASLDAADGFYNEPAQG